jgi:uncharacterized membrane protein
VYPRLLSRIGLLLVIIGASLFFYYLLEVESGLSICILLTAVALMAFSAVFSYLGMRNDPCKNTPYFLLTITILYFSLSIIQSVRFEAFSGLGSPDNLGEYFVAEVTLLRGSWGGNYGIPLTGRPSWYFSCLSVTIFPTIFSEITGLDLSTLFAVVYPIIFSLIPTLIFLLVREVFNKTELAALSTILYSEMFRFTAPQMGRQFIAIIFLVLVLFIVFKEKASLKAKNSYFVLFFFFALGVITSHYTVGYFLVTIFVILILALNLSSARSGSANLIDVVNKYNVTYLFVLNFLWLIFSNAAYFAANIKTVHSSILAILGLVEREWRSGVRMPGRTAGILVSSWYGLQILLAIVGLCLVFFEKRKDSRKIFAWTSSGLVLFMILLLSIATPIFSKTLSFNRVYSIAAPICVSFLAYVLLKMNRKSRSVFLIIFLALNLPINLYIPSYNNLVILSPIENVYPEQAISQSFCHKSELAMFEWAQELLKPNQSISVDNRGFTNMYSAYSLTPKATLAPQFGYNSIYLALHYYNLKDDLWWSREGISEVTDMTEIITNSNTVYSNAESMLLKKQKTP